MHTHNQKNLLSVVETLRKGGFRLTKSKVTLLELMEKANKPLSVQNILTIWQGVTPNETTLYRALTDLSLSGIVKRLDLNTGIAHFEYAPLRPHHHHLVCTGCGLVEEIEKCSVGSLQKKIELESKSFTIIESHNLEFFGHCVACSK